MPIHSLSDSGRFHAAKTELCGCGLYGPQSLYFLPLGRKYLLEERLDSSKYVDFLGQNFMKYLIQRVQGCISRIVVKMKLLSILRKELSLGSGSS